VAGVGAVCAGGTYGTEGATWAQRIPAKAGNIKIERNKWRVMSVSSTY
jgi:hypothetical protein